VGPFGQALRVEIARISTQKSVNIDISNWARNYVSGGLRWQNAREARVETYFPKILNGTTGLHEPLGLTLSQPATQLSSKPAATSCGLKALLKAHD
jgi:hypothetical protein